MTANLGVLARAAMQAQDTYDAAGPDPAVLLSMNALERSDHILWGAREATEGILADCLSCPGKIDGICPTL